MLSDLIEKRLGEAVRILPFDVEKAIEAALKSEDDPLGLTVLTRIKENIEKAKESPLPLCQDTGMFTILLSIGKEASVDLIYLISEIEKGCKNAAEKYFFRKSIVSDPIYDRKNTKTNMPLSLSSEIVDGSDITIGILLKGFGSENCSSVRMLRPTGGEDAVVEAVLDIMKKAGGKPCPPVFLGIGVGGTMEKAAFLSKKALLRDVGVENKDARYSALEKRILREVNSLNIGPGGLGGKNSCLSVSIEYMPTHIAGLPLAVSVNCWADRKVIITLKGGVYEENA